jgi:hypothetical protein
MKDREHMKSHAAAAATKGSKGKNKLQKSCWKNSSKIQSQEQ